MHFWCLFFKYSWKSWMCLSQSLQSSLLSQILSAPINAVCLNSWKIFMIVTLLSCIGSSQRVMKSDHLKDWSSQISCFLPGLYPESLSKCFSRSLIKFFNTSWDFSELWDNENKECKFQMWIQGPLKHQRWSSLSW